MDGMINMENSNIRAGDIISKSMELNSDFTIRANLQVIERIPDTTKYGDPYFHFI